MKLIFMNFNFLTAGLYSNGTGMIPAPSTPQDTGTIALVTILIATTLLFVLTTVNIHFSYKLVKTSLIFIIFQHPAGCSRLSSLRTQKPNINKLR